jgi:hypothetical protein
MRKTAFVVLIFALAVPGVALAGFPGSYNNDYEGVIEQDESARFGFDVSRTPDGRVVNEFDVVNIPVGCLDNFGTAKRIDVVVPQDVDLFVVKRRFGATIPVTGSPDARLKVSGEILSGALAKGTVRVRTDGASDADDCYSGLLRWKDTGDN